MSGVPSQRDLERVLADLEAGRESIPWTDRRSLATSLVEALANVRQREAAVRIVHFLADDRKWEVRKEVASLLPSLPDHEFAPLAAKLIEDSNGFVRKAAERSFERRRRGRADIDRRSQGIPELASEIEELSRVHGRQVGEKVRRLSERLYDNMAGAAVHEIRGILTPLKKAAFKLRDNARRSSLDPNMTGTELDTITQRLDLLERFIDDMGAYSESVPAERTTVRIKDVVDDACQCALDSLQKGGRDHERIAMPVSVDPQLTFPVARHYIFAALRNVITNSCEAVLVRKEPTDTGRVAVEAKQAEDGELRIVVEDNGVGISDEDLSELQAFVPGRISRKGNGTGFGLPSSGPHS